MSATHPIQQHRELQQPLNELYNDCTPAVQMRIDTQAVTLLMALQEKYPHRIGFKLSIDGGREIVLRLMACCGLEILE